MPGPTARLRGVVVGRALKEVVSEGRRSSRRRGCGVMASLSKPLGDVDGNEPRRLDCGKVGLESFFQGEDRGRSGGRFEVTSPDRRSPFGDDLMSALGFTGLRCEWMVLLCFGWLVSDLGRDGGSSWRDAEGGGFVAGGGMARAEQADGRVMAFAASNFDLGLLLFGPGLGPWTCYFYVYFMVYCFLLLSRRGFMPVISPYHYLVGRRGRCPGLHTQCALSGLARRRAICLVKWTQPPSGRMKLSVAGLISVRQHSRKAVLFVMMLLPVRVIFPVCHRNVKANGVAIRALFANWCLLEYIGFEESLGIVSGSSLCAYCNMGFRLYVPPLYSAISLIKA